MCRHKVAYVLCMLHSCEKRLMCSGSCMSRLCNMHEPAGQQAFTAGIYLGVHEGTHIMMANSWAH